MTAQLAEIWDILDEMKGKIELQNAYVSEIQRQVKFITKSTTQERTQDDQRNLQDSAAG
jgi:hypothetical protein